MPASHAVQDRREKLYAEPPCGVAAAARTPGLAIACEAPGDDNQGGQREEETDHHHLTPTGIRKP